MIFLGVFKAGTSVKYRANFHNDQGTIENPTSPEAQLETPAGVFSALTTPAIINSKTGHYGGAIDTTGFAVGQYLVRMQGTVATAKTTAAEFCFQIVAYDPTDATRLGLAALPNADPSVSGGLPTVDANNRIAGIQGTKNTLDNLNDISSPDLSNLDAAISTRLASTGYVAPDNAGISTIQERTDNLPDTPAAAGDVQAGLTAQGYTATRAAYLDALNGIASAVAAAVWNVATSAFITAGSIGKYIMDNLVGATTPGAITDSTTCDSMEFYRSLLASINTKIQALVENPQVDYQVGGGNGTVRISASQKMSQMISLREHIMERMVSKPEEVIDVLQSEASQFGEDLTEYIDGNGD